MLTITTRAMTAEERAVVERWASASKPASRLGWLLFWILGVPAMAAVAAIIARLIHISFAAMLTPTRIPNLLTPGWDMLLGAGVIILGALIFTLGRRARRPRAGDMYRQALASAQECGEVEVLTCTVTEAVVIEGDGKQPALFVLDVGDGKLLVLQGLDVLELVMAGRFPNTRFTVVRLPAREDILAVETQGEHLKPSHTRSPLTAAEFFPGACVVLDGTLAELDTVLKRPAATPAS
jgi:hypothetical protein